MAERVFEGGVMQRLCVCVCVCVCVRGASAYGCV